MAGSPRDMRLQTRMARPAVDNSEADTGLHKDSRPKETCMELRYIGCSTPSREGNRT